MNMKKNMNEERFSQGCSVKDELVRLGRRAKGCRLISLRWSLLQKKWKWLTKHKCALSYPRCYIGRIWGKGVKSHVSSIVKKLRSPKDLTTPTSPSTPQKPAAWHMLPSWDRETVSEWVTISGGRHLDKLPLSIQGYRWRRNPEAITTGRRPRNNNPLDITVGASKTYLK